MACSAFCRDVESEYVTKMGIKIRDERRRTITPRTADGILHTLCFAIEDSAGLFESLSQDAAPVATLVSMLQFFADVFEALNKREDERFVLEA